MWPEPVLQSCRSFSGLLCSPRSSEYREGPFPDPIPISPPPRFAPAPTFESTQQCSPILSSTRLARVFLTSDKAPQTSLPSRLPLLRSPLTPSLHIPDLILLHPCRFPLPPHAAPTRPHLPNLDAFDTTTAVAAGAKLWSFANISHSLPGVPPQTFAPAPAPTICGPLPAF